MIIEIDLEVVRELDPQEIDDLIADLESTATDHPQVDGAYAEVVRD